MTTPTLPRFLHWLIPIGLALAFLLAAAGALGRAQAAELETIDVEGQPLAANAERLQEAIAEAEGGRLKEMSLEAVRSLTGGAV